jgi:vesicle coat complex subunit
MFAINYPNEVSHIPLLSDDVCGEEGRREMHNTILSYAAMALTDYPEVVAYTNGQGKVAELRAELAGAGKKDKNHASKKNALKKIVANMTMSNNDMVALFPDIVACMEIPVLEIKKM